MEFPVESKTESCRKNSIQRLTHTEVKLQHEKSKIDLYLRLNRTKNRRIELKTKTKMENSHPKQISKAKTIQIHEDENHIINSTKTRLVYLERCVGLTTKTKSKCARALAKMEIDRKRNIGIFGRVFEGPAKLRT